MKVLYSFCVVFIAVLSFKEYSVSTQILPVIQRGNDNDDLGVLLAVLLLANKNNNNCCNCCGGGNIPIPYPIPIPTNNPIITSCGCDGAGNGGSGGKGGNAYSDPNQNIYIETTNDNDPTNNASSRAGSSTKTNNTDND